MGTDVETRPDVQRATADPVAWVVVEPALPEPGEAASCAALLRAGEDGRQVLTTAPGQGVVTTRAGRVLLLVRGADDEQAQAVRVVDGRADAAGGVEVELLEMRSRRPLRSDDRFAVSRTDVEVVGPFGPQPAKLHDVSIEGLRLSTPVAPEVGDDVKVRGELTDELGESCPWELRGQVVWADVVSPSLTLMGIHIEGSQRAAAVRLVQWARRRGGTRTAVPTP